MKRGGGAAAAAAEQERGQVRRVSRRDHAIPSPDFLGILWGGVITLFEG